MRTVLPALLALVPAAVAWGQPLPSSPSDASCRALPIARGPLRFAPGEVLEFDVDALGAQAAKLTLRVKPSERGQVVVEARVQTNTFFSKIRRVTGAATSFLDSRTLHPARYVEDALENDVRKTANVTFSNHTAHLEFTLGTRTGGAALTYAHDGLDVAGAIYLARQLPFKVGESLCFDVYGIRTLWRVSARVEAREHVSVPLGEFEAFHISGEAVRMDDPQQRRQVHLWLTDDSRRLPLAALGMIDLGTVRATLTAFQRPGEKGSRAAGKQSLKW